MWIKHVVKEHSECLPIARVCLPIATGASVSTNLPLQYSCLFSNKLDQLL